MAVDVSYSLINKLQVQDQFNIQQHKEACKYLKHAREIKQDFIDDLSSRLPDELDYFDFCE